MKTTILIPLLILAGCASKSPQAEEKPAPKPDPVHITQFYASPANPSKGEKTMVCYGVENATEVKIDPPVDRVWPSLSRCLELHPAKTETYTLTASGAGGSVTKSITVAIGPPAVKILEVSINKLKVSPGEEITVCYKVRNARQVSLRPGDWVGPHTPELGCIADHPQKTTTYTVVANGAGGSVDSEHVTATVQ